MAGAKGGGEVRVGRGEAGWLVRWWFCSSALPSICLSTAMAQSPETGCLTVPSLSPTVSWI